MLSLSIYGARAAWDSRVVANQSLTPELWNDLVAKVEDLDNQVNNTGTSKIVLGTIEVCIQCATRSGMDVRTQIRCTKDDWSAFTNEVGWNEHDGRCRVFIKY